MRRLFINVFALALCLTAFASTRTAAQERLRQTGGAAAQKISADVQKVYVGDMGTADEADRFRFLLEEQLAKKGFTVVSSEREADAVLTGALSVRVHDEKTEARAFVQLHAPGGARLWAKDFGHKRLRNPFSFKEPTRRRAEEVAEAMRREFK
ncbi:MAG TPA: hypothetical protein VFX96_15025 [Pyrinomonadaceae bacterium]|nr:hypothetical protein [Pyrinomonadaceae bacterium]